MEDEWLEAGGLEKFDNENDFDDDIFMDAEIDNVEQGSYLEMPTRVGCSVEKTGDKRTNSQGRKLPSAGTKYSMDFQQQKQQHSLISSNKMAQSLTTEPHEQPQHKTQGSKIQTISLRATRDHSDYEGVLFLSSPFPNSISRKRPGDSIFKASREQNQK